VVERGRTPMDGFCPVQCPDPMVGHVVNCHAHSVLIRPAGDARCGGGNRDIFRLTNNVCIEGKGTVGQATSVATSGRDRAIWRGRRIMGMRVTSVSAYRKRQLAVGEKHAARVPAIAIQAIGRTGRIQGGVRLREPGRGGQSTERQREGKTRGAEDSRRYRAN